MSALDKIKIYVNGHIKSAQEATISIFDSAFTGGDLVLEVFRTFQHKPYHMEMHMERLFYGLQELQIAISITPEELTELALKVLNLNMETANEDTDWQFIIYISKGLDSVFEIFEPQEIVPSIIITYLPLCRRISRMIEKYRNGVDIVVTKQQIIPSSILPPQIKSRGRLDYKIARLQTKAIMPGASGVLCDSNGNIMEGSGSNIFLVQHDTIITPPANMVVNGVTRQAIILIAQKLGIKVEEKLIPLKQALKADEMFLTSTIIGILHARSFEGKILSSGECGKITSRIKKSFEEDVGVNLLQQANKYKEMELDGTIKGTPQ